MLEGSLYCNGIDPQIALKDYWCVSYQPSDPICSPYRQPACSDLVESQTTSCPLPHYSGVVNQARSYTCTSNSWSPWYETSNNCTQDPPTCQASTETQTLACQQDYVGSITQVKTSSCSDPYGSPVYGEWITTSDTCVKSATNTTNISSPVSPSSPLNPVNTQTTVEPAGLPTNSAPEVVSSPLELKVEQPKQEVKSEPKAKEDNPKETPKAEQKSESKESPKLDVPKGKQLVHGFGIVLSLEILNKPIIQQIELTDAFKFDQEINNDFGKNENFKLELLQLSTPQDDFNSIADSSWKRLRRHNFLQQDGFGN
jgi:hypothetical protein